MQRVAGVLRHLPRWQLEGFSQFSDNGVKAKDVLAAVRMINRPWGDGAALACSCSGITVPDA